MKQLGYDMPISCLGVLADLWQKDGVPQKQLGSSLIKNKSSITKMLEALEGHGLVEKRLDPDDKRNKLIFLTEKGNAFKDKLQKKAFDKEQQFLPNTSTEDIKTAKRVLKALYLNLSKELFKNDFDE